MNGGTIPHRLDGLMDSVLTVRFVISLIVGLLAVTASGAVLVWQAGRFYETLNENIATQSQGLSDLKAYIASRALARDVRDNAQDDRITSLEIKVNLLQWRADNLK